LVGATSESTDAARCLPWENEMSFALYMIGFIVFMGGMVWAAVVAEVPHLYIGLAVMVLLGFGVLGAIGKSWIRQPRR